MHLSDEGIIFRQTKTGDGRRMILLFTKKYGKISVGAGAGERGKSRSSLALRPFTHGSYQIFQGRNYYNLDKAETIESYYSIGEDLDKYMYASYVLELTEKLIPEEVPQPGIFSLLIEFLAELSQRKKQYETLVLAYEVKVLRILGMFPELTACTSCGHKDNLHHFSVSSGGMVCDDCVKNQRDSLIYSPKFDIVGILNYFALNSLRSFRKIALDDAVAGQLQTIIRDYISYHLDIGGLKSESIFMNRF